MNLTFLQTAYSHLNYLRIIIFYSFLIVLFPHPPPPPKKKKIYVSSHLSCYLGRNTVNVGDLAFYQIGFLTIFYISLAFFLMTSRYEKYQKIMALTQQDLENFNILSQFGQTIQSTISCQEVALNLMMADNHFDIKL